MQRLPAAWLTYPTFKCAPTSRPWQGGVVGFLAFALLASGTLDASAKPKPPRTGMGDCSVGEREAIRNQQGQDFLDHCFTGGGTMYCDSDGYFCCTTSANGAEICSGQDWGGRPTQKDPRATPARPPATKVQ